VTLNGVGVTDHLISISDVSGTVGNDTFTIGAGHTTFDASGGSDTFDNGKGLGDVTVSYGRLGGSVVVNLAAGTATKSGGGVDTLTGVTSVIGSA
jgi:hypothetical protein